MPYSILKRSALCSFGDEVCARISSLLLFISCFLFFFPSSFSYFSLFFSFAAPLFCSSCFANKLNRSVTYTCRSGIVHRATGWMEFKWSMRRAVSFYFSCIFPLFGFSFSRFIWAKVRRERIERVNGVVKFDKLEIYVLMRGDHDSRPSRVTGETHELPHPIPGTSYSSSFFLLFFFFLSFSFFFLFCFW